MKIYKIIYILDIALKKYQNNSVCSMDNIKLNVLYTKRGETCTGKAEKV